mmetsp:Transcript_8553/g.12551  ORF Transcript_8553/g.12551 Transcript_8553/m.12551 type:complete len:81 (+) Transcript_8553:2531-2773(+)
MVLSSPSDKESEGIAVSSTSSSFCLEKKAEGDVVLLDDVTPLFLFHGWNAPLLVSIVTAKFFRLVKDRDEGDGNGVDDCL